MGKFEKILIVISICFYGGIAYLIYSHMDDTKELEKAYIEKGYTKTKVCTQYTYNWELKDE